MHTRLDHLVVVADTLAQGAAWCEATLGVAPGPGGRHARFGTHNRLMRISSRAFPRAYLEIIAIDPDADAQARHPGEHPCARWFDMDDPALQASVRHEPRLVHWVAATDRLDAALHAWHGLSIDPGSARAASRDTPQGPLHWRITVRDDGRRQFDGTLPTLIEWQGTHPVDAMAGSDVQLVALRLRHPRADALRTALDAVELGGVDVQAGAAASIVAELLTPKGRVLVASVAT